MWCKPSEDVVPMPTALKAGGTFVIVLPNVVSVKSFVARLTPWTVHRWFYAFRTYEGPVQKSVRHRFGVVGWRWKLVVAITRAVTFGLLTAEDTGVIAVLTKLP
jgi:hypothetical protein